MTTVTRFGKEYPVMQARLERVENTTQINWTMTKVSAYESRILPFCDKCENLLDPHDCTKYVACPFCGGKIKRANDE